MTRLPLFVKLVFQGMPNLFRHRHALYFQWLIVMQIVAPGKKTIRGLCIWAPAHVTEWRLRRLLSAGYWSVHLLLDWFAQQAIASFPPPEDGTLYLIGDGSEKPKPGKKNPLSQKGRKSASSGYFFGIRFVLLLACWDVYRIPVDFEIVLPKTHPEYQNENQLFRTMLQRFCRPRWAKRVVVLGDSSFASKDNMRTIQQLDQQEKHCEWYFLFSIARTWKMANGKALKDLVNHLPRIYYQKTWLSALSLNSKRRYYWYFLKKTSLAHLGDVSIVLSKKGRNCGPKKTKIFVTNLTQLSARQILAIYQKRWSIELLFKELKSGLGLGEHQVTKDPKRIEKSFAIAIIAYLVLIQLRKQDIQPGRAWGIFQLKHNFHLRLITEQVRHSEEIKWKKLLKAA